MPSIAISAVFHTGAEQRACDQTADNAWSVVIATVSTIAVATSAIATSVATSIATTVAAPIAASGEMGTASAKSTCVTAMKAAAVYAVYAVSAAMSAVSAVSAATRECRGRGRKCHCQTGSSDHSIFHNCLLHYG